MTDNHTDDVLRRMLSTPPKPHVPENQPKGESAKRLSEKPKASNKAT